MVGRMFNVQGKASEPKRCNNRYSIRLAKKFLHNTDGNIAILFILMSTVLFFFVGGAVDYSRWNAVRADMIESMDAASLAIARRAQGNPDMSDAQLKEYGKQFFFENFNYGDAIEKLSGSGADDAPEDIISFNLSNNALVEACVEGKLYTYLMRIVGKPYFDINECVEITKKGTGRVELALVLDVTGSMDGSIGGKKKINSLKDAVETMLDVMYDGDDESENLLMGVVPFNAYVNPGGAANWNSDWEDKDVEAYYHGRHFFHTKSSGEVDTTPYAMQENPPGGIARLIDPTVKVSHYELYKTMDEDWSGCVQARPYPLDELDTPPGESVPFSLSTVNNIPDDLLSIGPESPHKYRMRQAFERAPNLKLDASDVAQTDNSRWVPFFHPDEPDCDNSACNWSGNVTRSYTMSDGVTRDMRIHGWKFDDPDQGNSENAYNNRTVIRDHRYTNRNSGYNFHRYADVVLGFRYATRDNYQSEHNAYWTSIRNFLEDRFDATNHGDHEYRLRNSYVGVWNETTERYEGKYDLSPSTNGRFRGPGRDCPAAILPITNVRADIQDYVDGLSVYGNTNSANGALWGLRLLSPAAPFANDIAFGDPDWQKAVVLMTDGVNVASSSNTHWGSRMTAYGYANEERMGAGVDRPARGGGGFDSDRMADHIDEKLLRVCYRMKERGVLVYTIMFGLDDSQTEAVFRACATEPSEPYFHDAADGDDLIDAFGDIAADLVELHVSK